MSLSAISPIAPTAVAPEPHKAAPPAPAPQPGPADTVSFSPAALKAAAGGDPDHDGH